MRSEAAERAEFTPIRYAQVWEDADVLLAGLDVQPGDVSSPVSSFASPRTRR
jgi:S-adenosylmethionine-diacylglycerol 3-amino-3-carboxypropyl transferase